MVNKPSIFKTVVLTTVNTWRSVMDVKYNPLRFIPDPVLQTYIMVCLFTMWSAFFGVIAIYYIGWLGYSIAVSIAVHLAILIPCAVTNAVFMDAERKGQSWVDSWKSEQSLYRQFMNRAKGNIVKWDIDKES